MHQSLYEPDFVYQGQLFSKSEHFFQRDCFIHSLDLQQYSLYNGSREMQKELE